MNKDLASLPPNFICNIHMQTRSEPETPNVWKQYNSLPPLKRYKLFALQQYLQYSHQENFKLNSKNSRYRLGIGWTEGLDLVKILKLFKT